MSSHRLAPIGDELEFEDYENNDGEYYLFYKVIFNGDDEIKNYLSIFTTGRGFGNTHYNRTFKENDVLYITQDELEYLNKVLKYKNFDCYIESIFKGMKMKDIFGN